MTTQYGSIVLQQKVSDVIQYYEKEEDEVLDKQHSPLGKHATTEKLPVKAPRPITKSCPHIVFIIYQYHKLAKLAQSNTGSVTRFTIVSWFPGS